MKLLVERVDDGENFCGGKLLVNGKYFCDTLEDKDRRLEDGGEKIDGYTAIPRGTYSVIIDFSGSFHRELPHILDVPDFAGIRIHWGNSDIDTRGCILVGTNRRGDWVSNSRNTFARLFDLMEAAYERGETIEIEVK